MADPVTGFPFDDVIVGRTNGTPNKNNQPNDHNNFAEKLTILKNQVVEIMADGGGGGTDDYDTAFGL